MKVGGRGCVEYENGREERRILDASGVRRKKKKSRRAMQSLRSRWEDNGGGGRSRRKSVCLCSSRGLMGSTETENRKCIQRKHRIQAHCTIFMPIKWPEQAHYFNWTSGADQFWFDLTSYQDFLHLLCVLFYMLYVFVCVCVCGPQEESLQPWQLLTWIQLNKQRRKTQRLKASTLSFNVVLDAREYGDSHQQMTINSTK